MPAPTRSVRSLADLGTIFPVQLNSRQRHSAAYRARLADTDVRLDPRIPCSSCGEFMGWLDAVQRELGDRWFGYAHPDCEVDRARQARLAGVQDAFARGARRRANIPAAAV